ncbi:helix-turn-helix transcriptional regulator [Zobellella aerophila]|uniref:LuxR C-terminal-related transcriptional regulator n=1 Tax=Zobellella aerophila TaxID=870480 RepID=A0ABP6VVM4_9GAMM
MPAELNIFYLSTASCIEALGSERFYPRFFQLMRGLARIEQTMVFELKPDGSEAVCRLAHNQRHPHLGLKLASLYVDGPYQEDALLQELAKKVLLNGFQPVCQLILHKSLPAVYRQRFFNNADLNSKFAIMVQDEVSGNLFYINFYRAASEQAFSVTELEQLSQSVPIISALLIRQLRRQEKTITRNNNGLLLAGLSEREAQICRLIANALTSKAIARQLNIAETSVITYRRRAYQKLGINRKSELVTLLQTA